MKLTLPVYFCWEQSVQELYDFLVAGCDNCKFDSFLMFLLEWAGTWMKRDSGRLISGILIGATIGYWLKVTLYNTSARYGKFVFQFNANGSRIDHFSTFFSKWRWLSQSRLCRDQHLKEIVWRRGMDRSQWPTDSPSWRAYAGIVDRHSLHRDVTREIL